MKHQKRERRLQKGRDRYHERKARMTPEELEEFRANGRARTQRSTAKKREERERKKRLEALRQELEMAS